MFASKRFEQKQLCGIPLIYLEQGRETFKENVNKDFNGIRYSHLLFPTDETVKYQ